MSKLEAFRQPSIVDKITPLQGQAWDLHHQALVAQKSGAAIEAKFLKGEAMDLYRLDIHNKIVALFDRSDQQNAIIEVGQRLQREGKQIPIFTMRPQPQPEPQKLLSGSYTAGRDFGDEVDYTLMQQ